MIIKRQFIPKKYRSKKLAGVAAPTFALSPSVAAAFNSNEFVSSALFFSLFDFDADNNAIKAKLPLYSLGEISAFGLGAAGGGGGTNVSVYNGLDSTETAVALSANQGRILNNTKLNTSAISAWALAAFKPSYAASEITGLSSALALKANTAHTHTIANITDFAHVHQWSQVENKPLTFAPSAHTHTKANITDFAHGHVWAEVTGKPTTVAGYGISDVYTKNYTDFQISTALANVKIGGRNLLLNSAYPLFQSETPESGTLTLITNDGEPYYRAITDAEHTLSVFGAPIFLERNIEYVASLYVRAQNSDIDTVFFINGSLEGNSHMATTSNEWTRIELPVFTGDGGTGQLRIITEGATDVAFEYKKVKIERGNKVTDWTEAPEDVQARIDSKASLVAFNAHVASDVHLTVAQKSLLSYFSIVNGKIKVTAPLYSTGELSAYGEGTSGGGSGGGIVYDGLNSTDIAVALSANQGRILNEIKLNVSAVSAWAKALTKPSYTAAEITNLQGLLDAKVDDTQVLTNVPLNAKFTDTVYVHPAYTSRVAGLNKVTVDALGHVSAVTAIVKADITALGIPAQDTVYVHPAYTSRVAGLNKVTVDALGHVSAVTAIVKADITALGIPAQDTVYVHPATHPASIIVQDASNRFVSDIEKAAWTAKIGRTEYDAHVASNLHLTADQRSVLSYLSVVDGKIKINTSMYATGEVSAYGEGTSGVGSGSGIVYDGLNSTDTTVALSANQGRILNETKLNVSAVSAWAKALTKPSYTVAEIANLQGLLDGKVDDAQVLTNVPANAKFTDTIYSHPAYTSRVEGLYKITVDSVGHVSMATSVVKADITALGIPAQDTVYVHPAYTSRVAGLNKVTVDALGHVSAVTAIVKADITALGIPAQDTVYVHPATHPASIIVQDYSNRFVTDTEKATWNGKLNATAYSAADVLAKVKTVDGSGSGLDADTVDGKHANASAGAWWGNLAMVGGDGVMEIGSHIDFHETHLGGSDYDGRIACWAGNPYWNGAAMYHANNANLSTVDWYARVMTVATDINLTGLTSANKSLKTLLDKFDIDAYGNLIVKTNLYSLGEVGAYQSGSGISGLKLTGALNANGNSIYGVASIAANSLYTADITLGNIGTGRAGLFSNIGDELIATFSESNSLFEYGNGHLSVNYSTGLVTAPAYKFGNYTFKQDAYGRLGIYNGANEIACFDEYGNYINL